MSQDPITPAITPGALEAPEFLPLVGAPAEPASAVAPRAPLFSWRLSLPDVFFMALILWLFCSGPFGWVGLLSDGDTGWHIRTGEMVLDTGQVPQKDPFSFTKPGETWFAWEWLSDVVFALLHRSFGLPGIVLLAAALIAGSATVLLSHMIWRGASFLLAMPLTVIVVGVSSNHYLARPHVFTLFLLPVCLWIVDRDRRRPSGLVWALIPVTAIWTNLHGGFMALIACLGLLMAASAIECAPDWFAGRRSRAERSLFRYGGLTLGCAAATLVNPFGWRLHQHIAGYLQSTFIHEVVQEFQSPSFRGEAMLQLELLLMASLLAAGISLVLPSRDWAAALWVLFWAHQALHAVRHSSIFAMVAAPLAASVGSLWFARLTAGQSRKSIPGILRDISRDTGRKFGWLSPWPLVFLCALAAVGAPVVHWPSDFPSQRFPLRLMHGHRELFVKHRTLTMDQWGDYLIYQSYPRQRVYVDGRSDFYGPKLGREYINLMNGGPGWEKPLARYGVDVVLAPQEWALERLLGQSTAWRMVERLDQPSTAAGALYVRRGSAADREAKAPGGAPNGTPEGSRFTNDAASPPEAASGSAR